MGGYILRIILFIKTAVRSNHSLDSGPQARAGLRHGVPVEGPHHLPYLLDQILVFVARLEPVVWPLAFIGIYFIALLLIHLCRNVTVFYLFMLRQSAETVLRKRIIEKIIF